MKADLWRLLVLWEYGGMFSDLDSSPNRLRPEHILPDDSAVFVVDKDRTTSFHWMAVQPRHPIVYLTLQIALYQLLWIWEIGKVNPVEVTGPAALRGGINEFLSRTTEEYKKQINFEWFASVVAGNYTGPGGVNFKVLGSLDNDRDHWVFREMPMSEKEAAYENMGMHHFSKNRWGEARNMTCFGAIMKKHNFSDMKEIPLAALTGTSPQCTDADTNAVVLNRIIERDEAASNQNTAVPIPKIIHQGQYSEGCLTAHLLNSTDAWKDRFADYDYYFHNKDAMNQLAAKVSITLFPELSIVWENASAKLKTLLWRLLVLFEYGGIHAGMNSVPNSINAHEFKSRDTLLAVLNKDETQFLAAAPGHSIIFLSLHQCLKNILLLVENNDFNTYAVCEDTVSKSMIVVLEQLKKHRRKGPSVIVLKAKHYNGGMYRNTQFRLLKNQAEWITTAVDSQEQ